MLLDTLPGVIIGALVRIFVLPGGTVFRLLIAIFFAPLGFWLLRSPSPGLPEEEGKVVAGRSLSVRAVAAVASGAGFVGGLFGIGGGSLLAPILVAFG